MICGNAECIKLLPNDSRIDVNLKNEFYPAALINALHHVNSVKVVKALLKNKETDTELIDDDNTALMNEMELQRLDCILLLIR
ncbi:MAG: hypothetical protein OXC48_12200 [Endozoicomonadaceae bacterium]|nr:hypothetical protein [Endozoicomonadaceae bacterium]